MPGFAKPLGALALAGAALALLVALGAAATARGKHAQCRNNLRQLGLIAVGNWDPLEPPTRTGRGFWQEIREAQYRDIRGQWRPPDPDPFVCPVHGRTASKPDDPARIDYRGPRRIRKDAKEYRSAEPLGADRPGNHPDGGGYVLRLDGSVASIPPVVDAARSGDPLWTAAEAALSD
jgi:hypothetical protein